MIRIGIADDHPIVRLGLKAVFSGLDDLHLVGEAANGHEAVHLVQSTKVDVLILDLSMPGSSGVDALAEIRAKAPDVRVLILSGFPEEHYATTLIKQGASGYLNKECETEEIVSACRLIAQGRRYVSTRVAEALLASLPPPAHEQLTEREFLIFLQLALGKTVDEIEKAVSLSVSTVRRYRKRVLWKMGLNSNSDLAHYARVNGLIRYGLTPISRMNRPGS